MQDMSRKLEKTASVNVPKLSFLARVLHRDTIPVWMLNDHFNEVAKFKGLLQRPDPDWAHYMEEQRLGKLIVITAHAPDDTLAGYAIAKKHRHPHYREKYIALDDLHYLMPTYRGLGNGAAMMDAIEKAAADAGCVLFMWRCKADAPHAKLYEKRGCKLIDLTFVKELTNEAPPV